MEREQSRQRRSAWCCGPGARAKRFGSLQTGADPRRLEAAAAVECRAVKQPWIRGDPSRQSSNDQVPLTPELDGRQVAGPMEGPSGLPAAER